MASWYRLSWYKFLSTAAFVFVLSHVVLSFPKDLGFESYYLNWLTSRDPAWLLGANATDYDSSQAQDRGLKKNLRGFLLRKRSLRDLDLRGRYLKGINLEGYTLTNIRMNGAQLDNANFNCARLVNVDLSGASLISSSFLHDNCDSKSGTADIILDVKLKGAKLVSAILHGCKYTEGGLVIEGDLAGASFSKAELRCITLNNKSKDADPSEPRYLSGGIDFSDAMLDKVTLHSGNFDYSKFHRASIMRPLKIKDMATIGFSNFSEIGHESSIAADSCNGRPCVDLNLSSNYTSDSPLTLVASKMKNNFFLLQASLPQSNDINILNILCHPADSFGGQVSGQEKGKPYKIRVQVVRSTRTSQGNRSKHMPAVSGQALNSVPTGPVILSKIARGSAESAVQNVPMTLECDKTMRYEQAPPVPLIVGRRKGN